MGLNSSNKIDTNQYELEVSVDQEKFEAAVEQAFRKNVRKINVPGFRKGKAPRSIVEKMYGEGVFYEDAINILYPDAYQDAVKEAGIEPVDKADVEIVSVGKDGFTFKAKVTVRPEVEVGEYKGLKAEKVVETVTDEEVESELKRVQERNARIITVEGRPAQKGDTAVIDFEGFVDGTAFEGGKAEGHSLELGSGQFIPGFEDQIVGHNPGDEFDVNVKFPEDYGAKELAGKDATFKVKLSEIKNKELTPLDDEFAKDVSEFDTLELYKADIRKKLQETKDHKAKDDVENKLIDEVIAGLKAEIPEVMFERSVDSMVNDFDYRLQMQGLNLQSYLQYTGMELSSFRKTFREQAERQVKIRLALEKIAEIEKFEVNDEEIEAEYKKAAEQYGVELEKVKNLLNADDVRKDILSNKAVDLIHSTAVVTEVAPSAEKAPSSDEEKPKAKKSRKKAEGDSADQAAAAE
jgi:trigger factor